MISLIHFFVSFCLYLEFIFLNQIQLSEFFFLRLFVCSIKRISFDQMFELERHKVDTLDLTLPILI